MFLFAVIIWPGTRLHFNAGRPYNSLNLRGQSFRIRMCIVCENSLTVPLDRRLARIALSHPLTSMTLYGLHPFFFSGPSFCRAGYVQQRSYHSIKLNSLYSRSSLWLRVSNASRRYLVNLFPAVNWPWALGLFLWAASDYLLCIFSHINCPPVNIFLPRYLRNPHQRPKLHLHRSIWPLVILDSCMSLTNSI